MQGKASLPELFKMKPNPTPSSGTFSGERKLFCTHYDTCLDVAVEGEWRGFSCEKCRNFRPVEWNAEDRREDGFHCMALLLVIFSGGRLVHVNPGIIVESLERATRWDQEFGGTFIS